MISIGQRIYIHRLRRGLTQKELASRSGVTQANISNFEKGIRDVTVTTLFRLCLALEINPAGIFGREPELREEKFTRPRIERLARAIVDKGFFVPRQDRPIADLMKRLIHHGGKSFLSSKKTDAAWRQIRRRLTESQIHTILERVNDRLQRRHA